MALNSTLPALLKALRVAAGMSQAELAIELCVMTGTHTLTRHEVSRWETGRRRPVDWLPALAAALQVDLAILETAPQHADTADPAVADLAARVAATDLSPTTVEAFAQTADELRRAYPARPPAVLLPVVRHRLRQVSRLLDGRATLSQRRELMVTAAWLSLLAACLHEDLGHRSSSISGAETASSLGAETGHADLQAWRWEINAWQALLDDRYDDVQKAVQAGLQHSGSATSVAAQLYAQQARAAARRRDGKATRQALGHMDAVATRLKPEDPLDHFTFDPAKAVSYVATTLAWLRDGSPEAETAARQVLDTHKGQRRLATAHLDLGLILADRGELDEAQHEGLVAVTTRLLVPATWGRAHELADAVRPLGADLDEALREMQH